MTADKDSLRRFYVPPDKTRADPFEITGSEAGHISRVLRLARGDAIELFDGTGLCYRARIVSSSDNRIQVEIVDTFRESTESPVRITLAQGFLKERKMEDLIRPLTELGVHCIMPFYADRSVPVKRDKRLDKRRTRWETMALEAVKQCKRGQIPRIEPVASFEEVIKASGKTKLSLLFYEEKTKGFAKPAGLSAEPDSVMVAIGPEGGFSTDEVNQAQASGFYTVGLGPRILRAQTAAVSACVIVQYLYGDLGNR